MKILFALSICFAFAQSPNNKNLNRKELETQIKSFKQEMTNGMTPAQKKQFEKQVEIMLQKAKEVEKMDPKERERLMKIGQERMKDPKEQAKFKKALEQMNQEEKAMLQKMMKNIKSIPKN